MGKLRGNYVIAHTPLKAINRGCGGARRAQPTPTQATPRPGERGREGEKEKKREEREKKEKREKEEREKRESKEVLQNSVSSFTQRYFEMLYSRYHAQINI